MHFGVAAFCIRCRFRREVCLCREVQQVPTDLRLLVVIHGTEALKMSNTGHLAPLVVPDAAVKMHGAWGRDPADLSELRETHAPDGREWRTVLFFPGLGATPLTPEYAAALRGPAADGRPTRLRVVIPDGSWSQARRIVKRLPELAGLPRIILPVAEGTASREALRPRGNPEPARVSTCEAIAAALGMLGEPAAEAALFAVYDAAALRIALMRGKRHLASHRDVLV